MAFMGEFVRLYRCLPIHRLTLRRNLVSRPIIVSPQSSSFQVHLASPTTKHSELCVLIVLYRTSPIPTDLIVAQSSVRPETFLSTNPVRSLFVDIYPLTAPPMSHLSFRNQAPAAVPTSPNPRPVVISLETGSLYPIPNVPLKIHHLSPRRYSAHRQPSQ
jgi:hypothetical protein